jgi:hypothetical protein
MMSDELEEIFNGTIVIQLNCNVLIFRDRFSKMTEYLSHNGPCSGRYLNQEPPE